MIQEYFKTPGNFIERQRFHFINFASETFLEATPTVFLQIIIMITIIIPAPFAAEGCGWGGVVWILAVSLSLYLSLCFQPPPTHQHQ